MGKNTKNSVQQYLSSRVSTHVYRNKQLHTDLIVLRRKKKTLLHIRHDCLGGSGAMLFSTAFNNSLNRLFYSDP